MTDRTELVKVLRAHAISTFDGAAVKAFYDAAGAIEALMKERDEQEILLSDHSESVNDAIKFGGRFGAAKMQKAAANICMAKQQTWVDGKMTGETIMPYETDLSRRIRAISIEDVLK